MPKIILLNAPSMVGKDVAAKHLTEVRQSVHMEFKTPLFDLTRFFFSLSKDEFDKLYSRDLKEVKRYHLGNRSIRQAMIFVSEEVVKPNFGADFFGKKSVELVRAALNEGGNENFVYSDSGFKREAEALVDAFGADNVAVVRIYRDGYTFDGDSRRYLEQEDLPNTRFIDVHNEGTLDEFLEKMEEVFDEVVG